MPLYEYECEACGHRFEVIRKFSDPPLEQCTACGGPVRKLLSSPAIQFKGTGWYITDYARKGSTGSKDSAGGTDSAGAKDSSTDSASSSKGSSNSTSATSSATSDTKPS
jgi:putative FmdB family regulatory protein